MSLKSNILFFIFAIFLSLFLQACEPVTPDERREFALRKEITSSPEALIRALSNSTVVSRDPNQFIQQHGTQVEYHASNGTSYLWYPGNSRVVVGNWQVQAGGIFGANLCYRYGANTYNPITNESGGSWNCSPALSSDKDILKGNPFNLKPGSVPLIISDRGRYYPEHFAKWLGQDPSEVIYVSKIPRAASLNKKIAAETQ